MAEKKAAIISGCDASTLNFFGDMDEVNFKEVQLNDISSDFDCVLVPEAADDDKLDEILRKIKIKLLPAAVITFNNDPDYLERILDCGADDVIVLPMPAKLIKHRILSLCSNSAFSEDPVDFRLFDNIAASNTGGGSFIIQENDFANIYRFVLRLLERLDKKAQLLIFKVDSRFKSSFIEPEIIHTFSNVVQTCLRRGDISSLHGRQVFVILIGSDEEGGRIVAKRLIETFYAHCNDDAYDITYEIREINN